MKRPASARAGKRRPTKRKQAIAGAAAKKRPGAAGVATKRPAAVGAAKKRSANMAGKNNKKFYNVMDGDSNAEASKEHEEPFSVRFTTLAGTSGTVDGVLPGWKLIRLRHKIADQTGTPSYQVRLTIGDRVFSLLEDGSRLRELGITADAELSCVRQALHIEESDKWIQLTPPTDYVPPKTSFSFETHDNGGRPFFVQVNKASSSVDVRVAQRDRRHSLRALGVFVGRWCVDNYCGEHWGDGNSVLVHSADEVPGRHSYVFIGDKMYSFQTEDCDPILNYFSMVGNSDVPYPVALSDKRVYFMLDRVWVWRSDFREPRSFGDWEDAYGKFYEMPASLQHEMLEVSIVEARVR